MESLPNSQSLNPFISVLQFTLQFLC